MKYKLFKVSINLNNDIPGDVLFNLFSQIKRHGSIRRAAEEINVSYRYAWGLIKKAEETLGVDLVIRKTGGADGGGAVLTGDAEGLLADYWRLDREITLQQRNFTGDGAAGVTGYLLLATTLEPVETGLLAVLAEAFFKETGITVRHISAGSGQAIAMAEQGRVDIVFSHAPDLEREFLRSGKGASRQEVMYNPFVLVGPKDDPLRVKEASGILEAMERIARSEAAFISRADHSGTYLQEQQCWRELNITPGGQWYKKSPALMGNMGVLRQAVKQKAYALVDRATFLVSRSNTDLDILVAGGDGFQNPFSLITLNKGYYPHLNHQEAETFLTWMTGEQAQEIIGSFGRKTFRVPVFYPVGKKC